MIEPTDKQLMDLLWEWIKWKETGEKRPILKYFKAEDNHCGGIDFTDPFYRSHKK